VSEGVARPVAAVAVVRVRVPEEELLKVPTRVDLGQVEAASRGLIMSEEYRAYTAPDAIKARIMAIPDAPVQEQGESSSRIEEVSVEPGAEETRAQWLARRRAALEGDAESSYVPVRTPQPQLPPPNDSQRHFLNLYWPSTKAIRKIMRGSPLKPAGVEDYIAKGYK